MHDLLTSEVQDFLLAKHNAAFITYKNGTKRKQEIYYGSSFLSQSARFLHLDDNMQAVEIVDDKGNKRSVGIK